MDLLTEQKTFYFSSRREFKTFFGGVLSIIFIITSLITIGFNMKSFLSYENPFVNSYKTEENMDMHEAKNVTVIISIPKRVKEVSEVVVNYANNMEFFMNDCGEEELKQIEYTDSYYYGCRQLNLTKNEVITLNLYSCDKYMELIESTNDNTCNSGVEADQQELSQLKFYLKSEKFEESKRNLSSHMYTLDHFKGENIFLLEKAHLRDDLGWFGKDYKDTYFYQMTSYVPNGRASLPVLFTASLRVRGNTVIERYYWKFNNFYSQTFYVITIISLLLGFTYFLLSDYLYLVYALGFYAKEKERNKAKQENTNNHGVTVNPQNLLINQNLINIPHDNSQQVLVALEVKMQPTTTIFTNKNVDHVQMLISDWENIFTLRNYILYHLCNSEDKSETLKKFEILLRETQKFISLERIINKDSESDPGDTNINNDCGRLNESDAGVFSKFLRRIDIFTFTSFFLINKNKKIKSKSGKIFSTLYLIVSILLLYFMERDFWHRTNPILQVKELSLMELDDVYDEDVPIMISLSNNLYETTRILKVNSNYTCTKANEYNRVCSESEYKQFYPDTPRNSSLTYLCLNVNVTNPGHYFQRGFFTLARCSHLKHHFNVDDSECLDKRYLNDTLESSSFRIEFLTKKFNLETQEKNVIENDIKTLDPISDEKLNIFAVKLRKNVLEEDKDLIFSNRDNYEITSYNSHTSNLAGDHFAYFQVALMYEGSARITSRKFMKIQDMVVDVSPYLAIIKFIFWSLNSILCEYEYLKLFKDKYINQLDAKSFLKKYNLGSKEYFQIPNQSVIVPSVDPQNTQADSLEYLKIKENLSAEISLKNYIALTCCCRKKNHSQYLFQDMKDFLSIENLCLKKIYTDKTTSNVKNNLKASSYSSLISSFDLFNTNKTLLIQNNSKFKTKFGGVFTILFFISSCAFAFIFSNDFLYGKNPDTYIYTKNYNQLEEKRQIPLDIPIGIGMSKSLNNFQRFVMYDSNNAEYRFDEGIAICTEEDYKKTFVNVEKKQNLVYLCTNLNKLQTNFDAQRNSLIYNNFYRRCSVLGSFGLTDDTCTSDPDFSLDYEWQVAVAGFSRYDYQDNNKTLIPENVFSSVTAKIDNFFLFSGFLYRMNILRLEDDKFLSRAKETSYPSLISKLNWIDAYVYFSSDPYILIIRVVYEKFLQTISKVIGMINLLYLVFSFLYEMIVPFFYMKYLFCLFSKRIDYLSINSQLELFNTDLKNLDVLVMTFLDKDILSFTNYLKHNYLRFVCGKKKEILAYKLVKDQINLFIELIEII